MRKVILAFLFCAVIFCHPFISVAAAQEFGQLIHHKDSLYHHIFVYELGPYITLQFGRRAAVQMQSQVNVNNLRQHMVEYTKMAFCGLLYKPQPQKLLMVGLGGGVIPREMNYYFPELDIDVVEIDPAVLPIAKQFFGFNESDKLKVHIADGRMFIKEQLRRDPVPKYDFVFLDAFNSDYIPFHLMTKEYLEQVKGILAEDGVVIANIFYTNRLFDAELKTFLAAFGRYQVFLGSYSSNVMLVAPGPAAPMLTVKEAVDKAMVLQSRHEFSFDMTMIANQLRTNVQPDPGVKVLTDDCAPVNWLRTQTMIR
jgi:spermidine synthase